MKKQCIYCKTSDQTLFKGVEHVIPQSFGTFGTDTPTIHCVCDACNAHFAKTLDQTLARDTIEGVTRYKNGIVSRGSQTAGSLEFSLKGEQHGAFEGVILEGVDPKTGHLLPPVSQYWIKNKETNEWEKYGLKNISNLNIQDKKYGVPGSRESRVYAKSQEAHDLMVEELKKTGIPYKAGETFGSPPLLETADENGMASTIANAQGTIDQVVKRSFAKILLNFAAYILGQEEVLKSDWDTIRNYVRNDTEPIKSEVSTDPFWNGQETKGMRLSDNSINIRIENENESTVGIIQFYNLFTYKYVLAEDYSIPPEKEMAYRFTRGEKPVRGIKASKAFMKSASEEDIRRVFGI